jgi:hypothetical protein
VPELVLVNSHDGTSAYRFMAGIFLLVCSNGMVVQSGDTDSIAVRHSGAADLRERVIDATYQIMDEAPRTLAKIARWKGIELSPPQREAFATAALELKDSRAIRPAQLLAPRRPGDQSGWSAGERAALRGIAAQRTDPLIRMWRRWFFACGGFTFVVERAWGGGFAVARVPSS